MTHLTHPRDDENRLHDLDRAINSLKGLRIGMTEASRRNLASLCLEAARETRLPAWRRWLTVLSLRLEAHTAAGVLAALLVLGVTVFLAIHRTPTPEAGRGLAEVRLVSVAPTSSGGVTLEWRDGNQRVYRVLKSTSPNHFDRAESYTVRGNRWTDEGPSVGGVVFYRVE